MVRIMAGTLIEAGDGKIAPNDVSEIIRACNRKKAEQTAPSCGLYLKQSILLTKIFYFVLVVNTIYILDKITMF